MSQRKVRFRSSSHVTNFWLKMTFGSGTSYKRVAFLVLSAVGVVMLFVLAGWNHATVHGVVILSPGTILVGKYPTHVKNLKPSDCSGIGRQRNYSEWRCRNYEVYVILDQNATDYLRGGEVSDDFLRGLLDYSDCQVVFLYNIHVVFYKINGVDSKTVTRQLNETLHRLNETLQLCERSGAVVKIDLTEIPESNQEISTINRLMTDGYVFRDIDYFSVSFLNKASTTFRQAPLENVLKTLEEMTTKDVGVVFQESTSKMPNSFTFSRNHYEIFGVFLPQTLPDIRSMMPFLRHVYPKNLTVVVTESGSLGDFSTANPPTIGLQDVAAYEAMLQRYLVASAANPCLRCTNRTSRMIIAMSLYGDDRRYTIGAIRNAQLLPVIFPGWRLWFYVEKPQRDGSSKYKLVPAKVLAKLEDLGAELVPTDPMEVKLAPMLWRFTVMDSEMVDVFTVRDCDSRLTPRDAAVVSEWLNTDRIFHCIRDHPSHSNFVLSGGLWGARRKPLNGVLGNLKTTMQRYGSGYVEDMNFLGQDVWPKVKDIAYCHDSFSCKKFPSSHPFPVKRIGYEHIGQVYNELSIGRQGDMDILRNAGVNAACNPS